MDRPREHREGWDVGAGALTARFERVREVFGQVIVLDEPSRRARLDSLRAAEPALYEAVRALVAESDLATKEGFLDPAGRADRVSEGGPDGTGEPEPVPERIGRYRVTGVLGTGGTGVVYRGVADAPMRREAAIKVVRAEASKRASERFVQEIRALASLNHPSIAMVYESGALESGRRWAACELIDGTSVTEASRAHGLGWDRRVELIRQAAEGVHHAHARGVVHRDLKPSNILASVEADGSVCAKVIDFGVARLNGPRAPAAFTTEPGLLLGTLAYMSPEQLRGDPVDARTDVYALGLVLYELLSGRPAREGGTGIGSVAASSEKPLRARLPGCGGRGSDLGAVIACATDPDPDRRYPSAKHLAEDLERLLTGRPIEARRPSLWYRGCLYARRRPGMAGVVVGVLALVVLLGVGLAASTARLSDESRDQRALLAGLIHDTLNDLSTISGTSASRERMVVLLSERTDALLALHPNDGELLLAKARLLRERGDLIADAGNPDEALPHLRASNELYRSLYEARPADTTVGRWYAESIVRIGDVLKDMRMPDQVQPLYRQAMAIQERLLMIAPDNPTLRDDYCWSYDRLVVFFDPDDGTEEKWSWMRERLRLSRELYDDDPGRTLSSFNLGKAYFDMGRQRAREGRDADAYEYYLESYTYLSAAVERAPERWVYVYFFVEILRSMVQTEQRLGIDDRRRARAAELIGSAREHARRNAGNIRSQLLLIRVLLLATEWYENWDEPGMARSLAAEVLALVGVIRERGMDPDMRSRGYEAAARDVLGRLGPG